MRSTADRIRQAISFEIIGLLIVTPLFAWAFGHPLQDMGALALFGATAATIWNYVFNLVFDRTLLRRRGHTRKTPSLRVVHATVFEMTLLVFLLPLFAWWLDVTLAETLVMELSFALFYIAYAFVFTWGYDTLYPPETGTQATT
ncbi:PACE efflux transporter (plasmid) [Limimaricola variabilis]